MTVLIKDMSFGYSSTFVIDGMNLEIGNSKFYAILGPNGVGKSTLIRCINKILTPKAGTILIDDHDISEIKLKDMAKIIGYVPYSSGEAFPLSVVDTVLMGRHPHSKWGSLENDLVEVHHILEQLEIDDLAMRDFNSLSAGQHQKVMLARGLVQNPEILLLDEPTANLDVRHQMEVTKILKDLSVEKKITVVMICHDLNIAAKYADELVLLYDKKVFAQGTPAEVLTKDNLRTVYGVESEIIDDHGRPHVILEDFIR